MIRVIQVTGDSLSPEFKEGDYVVVTTIPFFLRRLKAGDTIVFQHHSYGTLIKKVLRLVPQSGEVYVIGSQDNSLDSRRLGPIPQDAVRGKVIWHIPQPSH
jgi:phage repressor protein C with HTH and peptisase S24 domain